MGRFDTPIYGFCLKIAFTDGADKSRTEKTKVFHSSMLSGNREAEAWIRSSVEDYIFTSRTFRMRGHQLVPLLTNGILDAAKENKVNERLYKEASEQEPMPGKFFEKEVKSRSGEGLLVSAFVMAYL